MPIRIALRPRRFKYTLRSLLVLSLLAGAGFGLWDSWNPIRLEKTYELSGPGYVSTAYYPKREWLAATGWSKDVHVWNLRTGEEVALFKGHTGPASCVAFSPDGRWLVTGGTCSAHFLPGVNDAVIRVWDMETGKPGPVLSGHSGCIFDLRFSKDGKRLASGSEDKTVCIWRTADWKLEKELSPSVIAGSLSFNLDATLLLMSSATETVLLWDLASDREVASFDDLNPISAEFDPSGQSAIVGTYSGRVFIIDAETRTVVRELDGHTDLISDSSVAPDGVRLATASHDQTAQIWNIKTGESIHLLNGHLAKVRTVNFSADGEWVVTSSADRTTVIWDAATCARLAVIPSLPDTWSVQFALDDNLLLIPCAPDDPQRKGMVQVWRLDRNQLRYGAVANPFLWLVVLLALVLVWSLWRDHRSFAKPA